MASSEANTKPGSKATKTLGSVSKRSCSYEEKSTESPVSKPRHDGMHHANKTTVKALHTASTGPSTAHPSMVRTAYGSPAFPLRHYSCTWASGTFAPISMVTCVSSTSGITMSFKWGHLDKSFAFVVVMLRLSTSLTCDSHGYQPLVLQRRLGQPLLQTLLTMYIQLRYHSCQSESQVSLIWTWRETFPHFQCLVARLRTNRASLLTQYFNQHNLQCNLCL